MQKIPKYFVIQFLFFFYVQNNMYIPRIHGEFKKQIVLIL